MENRIKKTTLPGLRKKEILDLLKDQDFVSTQEILKKCDASEITIRRDLSEMEKEGLLIRTHGGATKKVSTDFIFTYNDKMNHNREEKDYICQLASMYIKSNDIIFIDCGSTVSFLPKYISKIEPLTVITNSLPIVSDLIKFDNIKSILIGGEIDNKRKAIYGHSAIQNISQYHANKAFIGADGISLFKGITSYHERSASITLRMAENSDEVFLLCDSSKIEKNSFVKFAPLSIVNHVITDKKLDLRLVSKYEKQNVNLLCEKTELPSISTSSKNH